MSFVSVFATQDFITVMSDGLVTKEKNQEVLKEDYQKFHLISSKQFMAYTGLKGRADQFKEIVKFSETGYNLSQLSQDLYNLINKSISPQEEKVSIVVGGVDLDSQIRFYAYHNAPGRSIEKYWPVDSQPDCVFLESNYISYMHNTLVEKFNGYIQETGYNTSDKVLRAQEMLNLYVDSLDPTVNKNTFSYSIVK